MQTTKLGRDGHIQEILWRLIVWGRVSSRWLRKCTFHSHQASCDCIPHSAPTWVRWDLWVEHYRRASCCQANCPIFSSPSPCTLSKGWGTLELVNCIDGWSKQLCRIHDNQNKILQHSNRRIPRLRFHLNFQELSIYIRVRWGHDSAQLTTWLKEEAKLAKVCKQKHFWEILTRMNQTALVALADAINQVTFDLQQVEV